MADDLQFRNGNPGSVQYGNFINYYKFHPPENRINILPKDIWKTEGSFLVLDIGCNAGNLTISLYQFLCKHIVSNVYILGIDIDSTLIERAQEQNTENNIKFVCLDFMNITERKNILSDYLSTYEAVEFSAIFCFSITMWIHLNHGDLGLRTFLTDICSMSRMVIIEPQPWKCYKTAVRRLQLGKANFTNFKELKIRDCVEIEIEKILLQFNNVLKIYESDRTEWQRKTLIFKIG